MIEEEVLVTAVDGSRIAIEKYRKSSCSACQQSCASGMVGRLLGDKPVRFWVESSLPVQPGDRVMVGVPEESLVKGSALFYILPLLALLLGAAATRAVANVFFAAPGDLASGLGGLAGLVLSLLWLRFFRVLEGKNLKPVILRKIN